jgi:hypothetical protein
MPEPGLEKHPECNQLPATPTCARMAKMNHVWPTSCLSRSVMPELGSESTKSPECLQLPATHQHVPEWPK